MEVHENERRELLKEKRMMEIKALKRLLRQHDEFFNFINLHDVWYRWIAGRYSDTSIDSMGETLIEYLCKFCREHGILDHKDMSSQRILVLDYKGVELMLRKTDGKDEFSAISLVDVPHNFKVISWDRFYSFLEKELFLWMEDPESLEKEISIEDLTYLRE